MPEMHRFYPNSPLSSPVENAPKIKFYIKTGRRVLDMLHPSDLYINTE